MDDGLRDRLHLAVHHLATAKGQLRERVVSAYRDHVSPLAVADFKGKAREIFERIDQEFSAVFAKIEKETHPAVLEQRDVFDLAKSIQYLHRNLARRLANMICELRDEVDLAREEALSREVERLRQQKLSEGAPPSPRRG